MVGLEDAEQPQDNDNEKNRSATDTSAAQGVPPWSLSVSADRLLLHEDAGRTKCASRQSVAASERYRLGQQDYQNNDQNDGSETDTETHEFLPFDDLRAIPVR